MASSTDEAYKELLRLIVSTPEFAGPANRRQGIPVCDQQTSRNPPRRRLVEDAFKSFAHWRKTVLNRNTADTAWETASDTKFIYDGCGM